MSKKFSLNSKVISKILGKGAPFIEVIIDELLFPEPVADGTVTGNPNAAKYWSDRNKLIKRDNPNLDQPVDPSPQNDRPSPYDPPKKIYETNIYITNNYDSNLPDKPSSLLPVQQGQEVLRQTPTKVTIGAPITLAQSLKSQNFGQMLFNPFSDKKQKIRQARNENLAEQLIELNKQAIADFAEYRSGNPEYGASSAFALLVPNILQAVSGEIGIVFGKDTLQHYFGQMSLSSFNALVGVTDTIPNGYEIEYYEPQATTFPDNLDQLELGGSGNIELGEFFDKPVDWERWIEDAVREQYGVNNDEYNYVKVDNFPDLLRNVLAPFYFRTGLRDLPFVLPKDLTQDPLPGSKEEQIQTHRLSEFFIWQIKAIDSVLGQFPVKIRIQDTDLIKTGDQELKLEFPNLSELLTELIGLALSNQTNNNALLKTALIDIAETGQTKQQTIQNYYLLTAIQEYLGFKSKQISKEVDFLFNPIVTAEKPENQTLENALKPKTIKVAIESNDDEETLEKHFYTLIEAARIIKAVHWRSIDLKGSPGKQIADIIKQASKLASSLDKKEEEDLENFLETVEKGFSDKISTKDPNKPFNRNYGERPRIKYNQKDDDDTAT